MAYRPDGSTVLLAEWGSGNPLAGVEQGAVALPSCLLPFWPSGEARVLQYFSVSPICPRQSGLSSSLSGSRSSSASSLLCDLRK